MPRRSVPDKWTEIARQTGRTVRDALESWPRTFRLISVIFASCVAVAIIPAILRLLLSR